MNHKGNPHNLNNVLTFQNVYYFTDECIVYKIDLLSYLLFHMGVEINCLTLGAEYRFRALHKRVFRGIIGTILQAVDLAPHPLPLKITRDDT
jgi:hypothetical protein